MDLILEKYTNNKFADTVKRDYEVWYFYKVQTRQNAT